MDSTRTYNDILLAIAENTEDQMVAVNAYNLASTYYYYNSQIDSCLLLVKKASSLLRDINNHGLRSGLYRKLAILSRVNADFEEYEKYADLAFTEAKKSGNWKRVGSSLLILGNIHYNKNNYAEALKYYLMVDSVHNANEGRTEFLSVAYENIALIHLALDNDQALGYLEKSEAVHKELDNKAGVYNCIRIKGNYFNDR